MTKRKHNTEWSAEDIARMRLYAADGLSSKQAARKMGRTQGAVKYKAMTLRVRFRFVEQPRGSQIKALRTRRRNARKAA